jgi:hypothetical protein
MSAGLGLSLYGEVAGSSGLHRFWRGDIGIDLHFRYGALSRSGREKQKRTRSVQTI